MAVRGWDQQSGGNGMDGVSDQEAPYLSFCLKLCNAKNLVSPTKTGDNKMADDGPGGDGGCMHGGRLTFSDDVLRCREEKILATGAALKTK